LSDLTDLYEVKAGGVALTALHKRRFTRYTGLTTPEREFPLISFIHLRLLRQKAFLTTTSQAQGNNEMVGFLQTRMLSHVVLIDPPTIAS
jgi:hypothetical protein